MKVHLIKRKTIEDFVKTKVQSKSSFEDWLEKVKHADWKLPADMQATVAALICEVMVLIGLSLILEGITTEWFVNMFSERSKCIYLFAGLGLMPPITSYAIKKNSTQ